MSPRACARDLYVQLANLPPLQYQGISLSYLGSFEERETGLEPATTCLEGKIPRIAAHRPAPENPIKSRKRSSRDTGSHRPISAKIGWHGPKMVPKTGAFLRVIMGKIGIGRILGGVIGPARERLARGGEMR